MEEDEVNETKIERIKRHFKENQKVYIGIAVSTAVTIVIMTMKEKKKSLATINQVNKKGNNIIEVIVKVRRGHPGSMVRDDITGDVWPSINSAAKDIGVSPPTLAKHLKGKFPEINGRSYTYLGDAPATATAQLELAS